jgi:hypothetical protein
MIGQNHGYVHGASNTQKLIDDLHLTQSKTA